MIWDKETEGVNLRFSRPWQVAWSLGTLDELPPIIDAYPWFPDLKVSKVAARITRFDFNEYKSKARDPHEILAEFEKPFLNPEYIKAGHNIYGLDIPAYLTFRRALGLPANYDFLHQSIFIDTNNIAKARKKNIPIPDIRSKEFITFNFRMSAFHEKTLKTNLALTAKEFGIQFDYDSLHRGNNDVVLNRMVLKQMVWSTEI